MSEAETPPSLAWIRAVRDEFYETTKHIPLAELDEAFWAKGLDLARRLGLRGRKGPVRKPNASD